MTEALRKKIDEIDATPIRWKLMGIAVAAIAFLSLFVEIPVPLFPEPVTTQLDLTAGDLGLMTAMAIPAVWITGIYAGYVFHNIMTDSGGETVHD